MLPPLTLRHVVTTLALYAAGGAGGWLASRSGIPMPWMTGSLGAGALAVAFLQHGPLDGYRYPQRVRNGFIALIGVMIGTQVSPALLTHLETLPWLLGALLVFVPAAHLGNAWIFRRGGYDRTTALYAGTPGGLMESIALGEAAGGDISRITLQHFLRVILVVVAIPAALSIWTGHPVGSAAGAVPGDASPMTGLEFLKVLACAGAGLGLARVIRLPAAQILGPLLLTGALTLSGVISVHLPFWLLALAQVVVGTGLGLRFAGVTAATLLRAMTLSAMSVGFMLTLGLTLSLMLAALTGTEFLQLLLSFAPGGVTEMSLVALSLSVNPAMVSLTHVVRIVLTVGELILVAKLMPGTR
ncbi:AbrB family transcriptional regulator [Litorisediminicola beolgyonensis]|uniref:AbrB family transcriptional regulator n=1 Tax=Litorisediminicola beolgyonensis TaxID=1173614 RepID=A0ABW3ZHA7_9RHOB